MATAVFCTARTNEQASQTIEHLKRAGFASSDISVLLPQEWNRTSLNVENQTKFPEGATTGGTAGVVLGGVFGWLAGIGALAIPGVGPLIAAGPIMAALSGAAVGGTLGGLTGALIGFGIPEYEAKRYYDRVQAGAALLSVHSEDATMTARAKEIFAANGCENISSAAEASTRVNR